MKLVRLILFLICFLMLVSGAHARVELYQNTPGAQVQIVDESHITPSEINSKLITYLAAHPTCGNATVYMEEVSPNVWLYRKCVHFINSTAEYNGSKDCTELRLGTTQLNPGGKPDFGTTDSLSSIIFNDTVVRGWNETTNDQQRVDFNLSEAQQLLYFANMSKINANNLICNNTSFNGINYISIDYMPLNSTISNFSISDSYDGLVTSTVPLSYVSIKNLEFHNMYKHGVAISGIHLDISNISFENDLGLMTASGTGSNALVFANNSNCSLSDISINNSNWGAIYFGAGSNPPWPHDIIVQNITASYCHHNNIDIHGGYNLTLKNITSSKSGSDNFYVSGPYGNMTGLPYGVYNVTLDSIVSNYPGYPVSTTKHHIDVDTRCSHIIFKNVTLISTSQNARTGVVMFAYVDNVSFFNLNINGIVTPAWNPTYNGGPNNCSRLFDSYMYSDHDIKLELANKAKIINCKYKTLQSSTSYLSDYGIGYYGDIVFVGSTGQPLPNTEYTITFNNSSYSPTNAETFCENKTTFTTDTQGRSYSPYIDRNNSPVLYSQFADTSVYPLYANVSSAAVTLDNIVPDSRWYRSNISQSNYTITAIDNDSENLHLTGYAPSPEYNHFDNGSSVKMQIWTNEPMTSVIWKVEGVTKQTGTSTTYESAVGTAPITVDLTGSTATETITKSWIIDPTNTIDPEPEGVAPVSNFSAIPTSGSYPLTIDFTDLSTDSPSAWFWDFDNNGAIDSTEQNPEKTYLTKGNYTVTLKVSNDNGMDVETKTNYIQVTGTQPSVIPYFTNIRSMFNSFYRRYILGD